MSLPLALITLVEASIRLLDFGKSHTVKYRLKKGHLDYIKKHHPVEYYRIITEKKNASEFLSAEYNIDNPSDKVIQAFQDGRNIRNIRDIIAREKTIETKGVKVVKSSFLSNFLRRKKNRKDKVKK